MWEAGEQTHTNIPNTKSKATVLDGHCTAGGGTIFPNQVQHIRFTQDKYHSAASAELWSLQIPCAMPLSGQLHYSPKKFKFCFKALLPCHFAPQVSYALSSTSMILFESYLSLQLGNIAATVLEKNKSVSLPSPLLSHQTQYYHTWLSSSHLCYHHLLGMLAFALISHLVTVIWFFTFKWASLCLLP